MADILLWLMGKKITVHNTNVECPLPMRAHGICTNRRNQSHSFMTFSCTAKVISKIGNLKEVTAEKSDVDLSNWYVDLLKLNRKTYFLFTNSMSLFSFVIYVGTKKEISALEDLFTTKLKEQVVREYGVNCLQNTYFDSNLESFTYKKTNSRSILGSMNDFKLNIESEIQHNGLNLESVNSINHYLSIMPMGYLKYKSPRESFKDELDKVQ